jgi:hypothetical protein
VAPGVHHGWARGITMDLLFILGTVAFFALGVAYVNACDRL